jgi:hypothetical protein
VIWLLAACHPPPRVTYGPDAPLTVRRPPEDARRLYVLDDDGRTWFFDTGYARTTCDDDLVADLGLRTHGRVRVRGASGRVRAAKATLPVLRLGGHDLAEVRCTVRDLPSTSSLGPGVSGVVGMDVLRRFRLELAPGHDRIVLGSPAEAPLPGAVPFRPTRWHGWGPRLPVTLDGHTLWTLVDTGANVTCIDASRLGFPVHEVGTVHVRGTGADGGAVVPTWLARGATLAGHALPPLTVVSLPRPWFGPDLLGLDALSAFTTTWDFARREVLLTPSP